MIADFTTGKIGHRLSKIHLISLLASGQHSNGKRRQELKRSHIYSINQFVSNPLKSLHQSKTPPLPSLSLSTPYFIHNLLFHLSSSPPPPPPPPPPPFFPPHPPFPLFSSPPPPPALQKILNPFPSPLLARFRSTSGFKRMCRVTL